MRSPDIMSIARS